MLMLDQCHIDVMLEFAKYSKCEYITPVNELMEHCVTCIFQKIALINELMEPYYIYFKR